ncbi:MAG: L-threonylcarbamoyladenylate synthase [Tenuifilaceae bacterium]
MNIHQQIKQAAQIIKDGGLVAFPTETVYGLGANALNPIAVAKIFIEKERPSFDPLIVHIADVSDIKKLTKYEDERVYRLAEKFWPGPLTIVLPKNGTIPEIVTSGLPTVGLRMPNNEIALELIKLAECPIAAPSANKFGRISPTSANHVRKQLPSLSCILDGGSTPVGIESTVITLNSDGFVILRQGFVSKQDLETVLSISKLPIVKETELASPGLLKSHYSPCKPLYIIGESIIPVNKSNAGLLSFRKKDRSDYKTIEYLSHHADLKEAATNLFKALHRLEDAEIEFIVAESVPEEGIGIAIMDRLRKAAFKYKRKKTNEM